MEPKQVTISKPSQWTRLDDVDHRLYLATLAPIRSGHVPFVTVDWQHNLHKWHMAPTDRCQCGEVQTMIHVVESCPLTRVADDAQFRLHSADDGAVMLTWYHCAADTVFTELFRCVC